MEVSLIPVAETRLARLRGLALRRPSRAGAGLKIPRCRSVHTFGMLFRLDIYFLDEDGRVIREALSVGPCRVVSCRAAVAVLEIPSHRGE
ncbi:MAG: uncharacterized protein QOD60_1690 [Solirubrobacterales bacterium]|jgi:uncharacterized membrane protein (UPF0127 family)|nr:uncharacterized protein [Solirubrobacterales bacterium]